MNIPFSRPNLAGREREYVEDCLSRLHLSGDGYYSRKCNELMTAHFGAETLLVHSATAALEMAMLLLDIQPGDEVIMPSFTFVSTANAVVLRGGVPVFADVELASGNLAPAAIDQAVTPRTRAVLPVHYAGVGCDMTAIMAAAERHGLAVVEDAAQAYGSSHEGRPLGTFGALGCISFHATKNIVSGEGGALIINDPALQDRAHILREKGTNRTNFLRGEVVKYEWLDVGSSYLPGDITAALLLAQLERADELNAHRLGIWRRYAAAFAPLVDSGRLAGMAAPSSNVQHNAHIFFLRMPTAAQAAQVLAGLKQAGIGATSHFVPLHSAPAGRRFGRVGGSLENTDRLAETIVRLPLYHDLALADQQRIIETAISLIG